MLDGPSGSKLDLFEFNNRALYPIVKIIQIFLLMQNT